LDPNFAPPRLKRGIAYIYGVKSPRKDDYDRAIVDYTEAIRLRPDYSEAYFFRGVAYQNGVADADRAIADYTEAIRLKPDYGIAFSNRGIIYQNLKKDLPRAIADYTEAIRLLPNFAVPYYHRGLALKQSGGNGDLDIAKAKQLDPSVGD